MVDVSAERRSTTSTAAAAHGAEPARVAASHRRAGDAATSTISPAAAAHSEPRLKVRYSVGSVTTSDAAVAARTAIGSRAATNPAASSAAIAANPPNPFQ